MTSSNSRYVDLPSGRFHLLDWNNNPSGEALVLLHGFNQSAHSWDEFAQRACGEYRVIAPDQRGHGLSMRAGDGDYSRQSSVNDVLHLLRHLDIEQCYLVGMSMGAANSIAFTAQHPEHIKKLVIVDYAPTVNAEGVKNIREVLAHRWPSFEAAVATIKKFNPRRSEENIRDRLHHTMNEHEDGMWGWRIDPAYSNQSRFSEPDEVMWAEVRRIQCSALLVRGANSDILTAENADRMVRELPHGRLLTVTGAGHSVAGDNPEDFARVVREFLATSP